MREQVMLKEPWQWLTYEKNRFFRTIRKSIIHLYESEMHLYGCTGLKIKSQGIIEGTAVCMCASVVVFFSSLLLSQDYIVLMHERRREKKRERERQTLIDFMVSSMVETLDFNAVSGLDRKTCEKEQNDGEREKKM